jgi:hypothetical protein
MEGDNLIGCVVEGVRRGRARVGVPIAIQATARTGYATPHSILLMRKSRLRAVERYRVGVAQSLAPRERLVET